MKNVKRHTKRYSTCVHEAGHALMCLFYNVDVIEVAVHEGAPVENRLGYCHHYASDNAQVNLDIALIGPVVQAMFSGIPTKDFIRTTDGCDGDFSKAWDMIYISKRHILENHGSKDLLQYSDVELFDIFSDDAPISDEYDDYVIDDCWTPPNLTKKDEKFLEFYLELLASEESRTQEVIFDRLVYLEKYINRNADMVWNSVHTLAERLYVAGKLSSIDVAKTLVELWESKVDSAAA